MSEEIELALKILMDNGFIVLSVEPALKQFIVTLPQVR